MTSLLDTAELQPDETNEAELLLWRSVQRRTFTTEYEALSKGEKVDKKSKIVSLDPIFDEKRKIIIGGGRLRASTLERETKHPILLPSGDPLVRKMIRHVHESHVHAAQDTTLSLVQQKYHVLHCRQEVRQVLRKCLSCRHAATKPIEQKMGDLPEERVTPDFAWTTIGIDFTGVLFIKGDDGKPKKSYIIVFTCATSRMVHFELANDMSTEEFLLALR